MNHVTIYRNEFKSDVIFDQYVSLGFGKVSDDQEEVKFLIKTDKDYAEMFEKMDSDEIYHWIQNVLGGSCAKTKV